MIIDVRTAGYVNMIINVLYVAYAEMITTIIDFMQNISGCDYYIIDLFCGN